LEKKIFKKISDFSKSFIGKRGFFTQIWHFVLCVYSSMYSVVCDEQSTPYTTQALIYLIRRGGSIWTERGIWAGNRVTIRSWILIYDIFRNICAQHTKQHKVPVKHIHTVSHIRESNTRVCSTVKQFTHKVDLGKWDTH
jgi:hypothetical protein